jgi:hypothetical protein
MLCGGVGAGGSLATSQQLHNIAEIKKKKMYKKQI